MEKEEARALLRTVQETSLPEPALKFLYQEQMSEEEEAKAETFCKRLNELLNPSPEAIAADYSGGRIEFDKHEANFALLSGVEEKSLPEFALKFLRNEEMTPEEVGAVDTFCDGLRG